MIKTLLLSEPELEVVTELLEQERRNLPAEIHHTDSPIVHDDLQKRRKVVNALLERLQQAQPTAPPPRKPIR